MAELDGKQLDTQHSLELQETAIDEGKDDFMERIRAMYVAGGANSYTNVLINSSDFYDVLMRIELVTRVAKHDNDELEDLLAQYREQADQETTVSIFELPDESGSGAGAAVVVVVFGGSVALAVVVV